MENMDFRADWTNKRATTSTHHQQLFLTRRLSSERMQSSEHCATAVAQHKPPSHLGLTWQFLTGKEKEKEKKSSCGTTRRGDTPRDMQMDFQREIQHTPSSEAKFSDLDHQQTATLVAQSVSRRCCCCSLPAWACVGPLTCRLRAGRELLQAPGVHELPAHFFILF